MLLVERLLMLTFVQHRVVGSLVESPRQKNIPATAFIQLEFLFIDGIQRCQPLFYPNPNPKICST